MQMGDDEVNDILRLVSGILHLGNIEFKEDGNYSKIHDEDCESFDFLLN